jgi:phage tail-like protein
LTSNREPASTGREVSDVDFAYHATSSPGQWANWAGRNVAVSDDGIAVETEPIIDYHDLGFEAEDVAINREGTVYALRPSGDVYGYDRAGGAEAIWRNGDGETVAEPQAVCLAGDRVFVADADDASLVVISGRERHAIGRIDTGVEDLVTLMTGGRTVYILDAGGDGSTGRVATLRRHGVVGTALRGLEAPRDVSVDPRGNVSVLELTDDGPRISVFEARYVASPDAFPYRETIEDFRIEAADDTLVPESIEAISDEAVIVHGPLSASGEPATVHYRFEDKGDREQSGGFERRHGFDVRCSRLRGGPMQGNTRYPTYYGIATETDRVYAIEETKKYRRNEATDRFTATAFRRFDAGEVDTQWHRLSLGFDSHDSNTQVLVSYAATDENSQTEAGVGALEDVNQHDAADLRAAGITSVWDLVESAPDTIADVADGATVDRAAAWIDAGVAVLEDRSDRWSRVGTTSPEDALLTEATGRYLQVRLELVGDADTSPTVESCRVYCPRQTYLQYLPDLYRTGNSEAFLEQLLAVFETAYTDIEEEFGGVTQYIDPAGVPSEDLAWLDEWLAIENREEWPESARRELLSRAPTLFRQRGTRFGLRAYVKLYLRHVTSPDTDWVLEWQRRRIEDRRDDGYLTESAAESRLADIDALARDDHGGHHLFLMERKDLDGIDSEAARRPYTMHMPGPRSFALFVGPFLDSEHREVVESIVAEEKPAQTDGHVVPIRQHVKLEGNAFLGINTTLTPRTWVLGRSTLGEDTVLKARELL